MSRQRTIVTTVGIMLGLFMASMEATVISTAMPTIVSQLGGLAIYSWVFSVYMLASTTTVPIYGKLSDIFGRRPVFIVALGIFLVGSVLCGMAQSMEQLILFRTIQGIGAGGVMPLVFIIVGDIFSFEQRARMQGLFSGVWGVSSIVGPLLGGFLVDQISWHWVFYVNVLPGIVAALLVWFALQDRHVDKSVKPVIDYAGALLLTASVVALLLGLFELSTTWGKGLIAASVVLFAALLWVERRAVDPVLPIPLFRERLFASATGHGVLSGWSMFGSLSFVPLFVQTVLGTSATEAGTTLTPMLLGWVAASIVGSRLLLRMSYRTLAILGMSLLTIGSFLLSRAGGGISQLFLMIDMTLMGVGMGLSIPAFMISVQSSVPKRQLGTATSFLTFSRSIGGTLGVSVMGAFLASRLASGLMGAGLDPNAVSVDSLLDPLARASGNAVDGTLMGIVGNAISGVFIIAFIAAALGLIATTLAPRGQIGERTKPKTKDDKFTPVESGF